MHFNIKPLLSTSEQAYDHALHVGEPIPELEDLIATKACYAYLYAKDVLCSRFQLAETTIAADGWYSYLYAKNVLGSQFELGEEAIATEACYAYLYAKFVLRGRFELGEGLLRESRYWEDYSATLLKS